MKSFLLIVVLLIIIGAIAIYFTNRKEDTSNNNPPVNQTEENQPTEDQTGNEAQATESETFKFACKDYEFSISYHGENNDEATLTLPTGTHELKVAVSGSGARYTNEDDTVEYWEHQDTASVKVDGEDVATDCPSVE